MNGNGEKLSRHRERAIAALIQHGTIAAAAKACGVSESTLRRWKKDPAFARAYSAARRALVSDVVSAIQRASSGALATLIRIMTNESAGATAKVQAARTVLEMALRERPAGIRLPSVTTVADVVAALGAVAAAVGVGELGADEARPLVEVLEAQRRAIETSELERRIAALEGRQEMETGDMDAEA